MDSENINNIIKAQLRANKAGLDWASVFLQGTDLRNIREKLITNRLNLKRIRYATSVNAAAAVFGESQVGKSYLVDCLLSGKKGTLKVYDGRGQAYGFIESINPVGAGGESTSLITRFTAKDTWVNEDYPIKAVMLSPVDIVLTLCDAFFNDVQNHQFPTKEQIVEKIQEIHTRYGNRPGVQKYIIEDDIYEIKEYFNLGLFDKGESFVDNLKDTGFFENLAEDIQAVDVDQWKDIFGFLWNNNQVITEVFTKLVDTFRRLGFQKNVYIKMDAVLRVNGTLLQVDRIYELFEVGQTNDGRTVEHARITDMEVWCGSTAVHIPKSAFCALAAELVFKVDNEIAEEKVFLNQLDIMDFPGARSREKLDEAVITKEASCLLLLRGKVAYLFNKYSQQYLISNLLFCHHEKNSNVKTLSLLMKGWIHGMIGKTPEERLEFMKVSEISPLFLIGTKFNIDLKRTQIDDTGTDEERRQAKANRWKLRFQDTLTSIIGENAENRWFSEWVPGKPFDNIYLLRSYDYSCRDGIFNGYLKKNGSIYELNYRNGILVGEEEINDDYKEFLPALEKTFYQNEFVKQHFADPRKTWEEAATCNHDGSDWIIENLTKSSEKILLSREQKFDKYIEAYLRNLCKTLKAFYHDDNSDWELKQALASAGRIDMMLDALFGKDRYFFSDFISSMLVSEEKLYDVILNTISAVKVLEKTDLGVLFAIRDRAHIDPSLTYEENQKLMCEAYHFSTIKQLDDFLISLGLSLGDIINPPQVKNFACLIVDAMEEFWFDTYLNLNRFKEFVKRGFAETALKELLSNMRVLYKEKLNITSKITERIRPYVANPERLDDMAEMLADICAEMINRFVNTMGTAYFYKELWKDIEETVRQNQFNISVHAIDYEVLAIDEEQTKNNLNQVFDVFDNIDNILNKVPVDNQKLSFFSNYHAYRMWTEQMKIAFLATCGIPKYDILMNNELRKTMEHYILDVKDLQPLLDQSCELGNLHGKKASDVNL